MTKEFQFLNIKDNSIRVKYHLVTFDVQVISVLDAITGKKSYRILLPAGLMINPRVFPSLARDCVRYYLSNNS